MLVDDGPETGKFHTKPVTDNSQPDATPTSDVIPASSSDTLSFHYVTVVNYDDAR